MPVDPNNQAAIIAAIEKEYGKKNIHAGSESQVVPRIPFPSFELNVATGGGVPLGRISRWWGNWSSGKTLSCLNLIRNAQNLHIIAEQMVDSEYDEVKRKAEFILDKFPNGLEVAYYNVEGAFTADFAKSQGVDTDRLFVIEGSKIEDVSKKCESLLGAVHLHIVDSASAAASIDEISSDVEDWHRGIKARVWGKVLDHWAEHFDLQENSIVLIDQARTNQQTGFDQAPGGNKLEHASSLTINFKRGKWLFDRDGELKGEAPQKNETLSGSAEADGFEIVARVTKSRVGRPFRIARMQVGFEPDIHFNTDTELAKLAVYFETVKKGGSWYTLPNEEKVQGTKNLVKAINEDAELKKEIIDKTELHVIENP